MSRKADNNPVRTLGQDKSQVNPELSKNDTLSDALLNEQIRFYRMAADIGELFYSWLSGEVFAVLAGRITLLIRGAWLPGFGDYKTVSALTNKPESTIERIAKNRNKLHVGVTPFLELAELPLPKNSEVSDSDET